MVSREPFLRLRPAKRKDWDDAWLGVRWPAGARRCPGVIAFGRSLRECEQELHSTLEDWIWLGLKLGHTLPKIGGIDLHKEPKREPVDAL